LYLGQQQPAEPGAIKQLRLPLAHLDRVDGVIGGDLLVRLAATDRRHGDSGLERGVVERRLLNSFGEGFANGESPVQEQYPASQVNDGGLSRKKNSPPLSSVISSGGIGSTKG